MTCQSNSSEARGHNRRPSWSLKNGGMLISQPVTSCLTNHSELCMSRLLNNQSGRISIYRLQRRPSFGFESSVSSTLLASDDPVSIFTQPSLAVTLITLEQAFSSYGRELWPMTLTFELDLDRVKMNQLDRCLGLRSFGSKFVVGTHTPPDRLLYLDHWSGQ